MKISVKQMQDCYDNINNELINIFNKCVIGDEILESLEDELENMAGDLKVRFEALKEAFVEIKDKFSSINVEEWEEIKPIDLSELLSKRKLKDDEYPNVKKEITEN